MNKPTKIYQDDIYIVLQDENRDNAKVIYLHEARTDIKVGDYLVIQEGCTNFNNVYGNLAWYEYVVVAKDNASAYVVEETNIYEE
jgi:hypothetical protein